MTVIKIATSDQIIWNESQVHHEIITAMFNNQDILLDVLAEGPDIDSLTLYQFLTESASLFDYDLRRVSLVTSNRLEQHDTINIKYQAPVHLVKNSMEYLGTIDKSKELKHFGMFIGRSNAPRLELASYIDNCYADQSIYTYHFNPTEEFHHNNVGLEDLLTSYNVTDLTRPAKFLSRCPITLDQTPTTAINKSLALNPAQQLLATDSQQFSQCYQNFFVEIVCESYYTGRTFFVTEKTWRPILLRTPFIVQGPQHFLSNLRRLGFRTFDRWWDEGYSEDPATHQVTEIKSVLDRLAQKTTAELLEMYTAMKETLDHNYARLMTLSPEDFEQLLC